jgi:Protein of unknown function (DUF3102)
MTSATPITAPTPMATYKEPTLEEMAKYINDGRKAVTDLQTQAKATECKALEKAISTGRWLNVVKRRVGHGNWINWLKKNCREISKSTAERYMKLAENEEKLKEQAVAKNVTVTNLTINAALALLKPAPSKSVKASDAYDTIEGRLLTQLWDLADAEALAAATRAPQWRLCEECR